MKYKPATIDFETRSVVDLRKTGVRLYAEHPLTEVLCMANHVPGKRKTKLWWSNFENMPERLLAWVKAGNPVEAHNVNFEYLIWNLICVDTYDWPALELGQLHCTASRARACGLPGSLGPAGAALGLAIQKDPEGERLLRLLTMPQRITKANPHKWCNDPKEMKRLGKYCVRDVDAERALSAALPQLSKEERAIWLLDLEFNNRGVKVDTEGIEATLDVMERYKAHANGQINKMTKGAVEKGTQVQALRNWCASAGYPVPNLQQKTVEDAIADPKCPNKVRKVLTLRQAVGRGSTGKYSAMKQRTSSLGRVHETVIYYKAHTGRWGGTGIQTQNFPRPTMAVDPEHVVEIMKTRDIKLISEHYKNPFNAAVNALRPMMMAPKGKTLGAADFSAVEARILMWLANEVEALRVLRTGCIYTDMASTIYNIPYETIYAGYKAEDYESEKQRKFGKDTILGLGFQMGGPTFADTSFKNGTPITQEFAKQTVALYRKKYPKVVRMWKDMNTAAIEATITGKRVKCGKVSFKMERHWLVVRLPSKRKLYYPYARIGKNQYGKQCLEYHTYEDGTFKVTSTYGGKLVENIVQAAARDLLRDAMLRLDAAGFYLILTIHDEVVAEIPAADAKAHQQHMEQIMTEVPQWAAGLPIGVSGWYGKRYRKG